MRLIPTGLPSFRDFSWVFACSRGALTMLLLSGLGNSGLSSSVRGGVDSDGDLLSDADELAVYLTDPAKADTDADGTPDGLEIARGLDPNSAASRLDRPNIIFIMGDDLGYGDLGVLFQNSVPGTKKLYTPELDQFAAEGLILDQHYCPAPVCAPSRASFMNGVHQGHASVRDNQFDKELANNHNLANTLRMAGYSTALIGKWGMQGTGTTPATWTGYPTKRGFDYFFGYVRHADGHTHYPAHTTPARPSKELYDGNSEISSELTNCYTADLFTARAKKRIVDEALNNPNQPFFVFLAFDTPHAALHLPTQAYPAGGGLTGGLQWVGTPGQMINTASGTIDSYVHPDYDGHGWSETAERFATAVRRLDDCVGDIIQTLEDLSIDDDTLIVFSSDNGPHTEAYTPGLSYRPTEFDSFGPFDGIKRDTWEGGIRMPTLVRWPGAVPAGLVNHEPSQFHDWLATFTDLAGWTTPARCDGVSLLPTLTGVGVQREGLVYVEYFNSSNTPSYSEFHPSHRGRDRDQMQVIHLDGYKGIRVHIQSHDTPFEIYDLALDPQETMNLAGSSSYFDELQDRMKARVLAVRQPNSSATRPYDSALVPGVGARTGSGLVYQAYEGLWPWVPELTNLTPLSTGIATGFDLNHLSRPDDAGLLFRGYLDVPSAGLWTFKLSCDTGALLRIHESQVIDDDFNHTGAQVSGTLRLEAGLHPIRLYYRTGSAQPALSLRWAGPGVAEQSIPTSALVHDSEEAPGIIAHYRFDETTGTTLTDSGPNGIHGSYVTGYTLGQPGAAPGTGTSVQLSSPPDGYADIQNAGALTLPTNDITISLWFNLHAFPPVSHVILGNLKDSSGVARGWQAAIMAIGPRFQTRGHQNYYLAAPIALDRWTHVAYVFDASNDVTFYVDGQLIGTVLGSSPADPPNPDFRVGGGDTAGFIDAHLDDLQVYDGSLTAEEIAWLFAHPGAVLDDGPGTSYCSGDGVAPHTLCPCGNSNDGSMGGCYWGDPGFPAGGVLTATGSGSLLANDCVLTATGVSNNFGVFFGADNPVNGGNGNPLNDGLRCAGGSLVRLTPPTMASGNLATTPLPVQTLDTGATAGVTRRYQYWFRTPSGPCSQMANLTNGLEIGWTN